MKMRRGFLVVVAALGLSLLLSLGAFGAEPIKIGLLAPITGFAAADGESMLNSVKLAVEEVNAAGGVLGRKVQLVYYDDAADPKQAVPLAQKLIKQDRVVGVVGGSYSMPSRAVAPIFDDEEIPFIAAYAIHPDVTKGDYTFRNGFLGAVEGQAAAYTAVKILKGKRIAIITSDNDFGRTLAEGFKKYMKRNPSDAQLVLSLTYPMSEKDFKAYLAKVKEANADVVFASGYYFQTGPMLKQAREMGITAKFLGEEGADSPKTIEIAGKAAEGFVIVTNLNRDDPRPVVQKFLKEYRKRYKTEPDMVGASGYDAFRVLVDSIKRAGSTDRKAVRNAMAETANYNGLTGIIRGFDKEGEVIKPVQVQVVKNGKFRYLAMVDNPAIITPRLAAGEE
ncbi:MAG: ABC transporter substrate-binding protein [Thermanaerothrix sp.]|nr:ABC transporter substrate-binding protein [Thermanaerothrix sp.]